MRYIEVYFENSKSRRGLHRRRRIALKICGDKISEIEGERIDIKPTYVVGDAYMIRASLERGCYVAQIDLKMNIKKRVFGYIYIYNENGEMILKMKYRKLKFKLIFGDVTYRNVFLKIVDYLKIPYKNINWRT